MFTLKTRDRKKADVYPKQWVEKKRIQTSLVVILAVMVNVSGYYSGLTVDQA